MSIFSVKRARVSASVYSAGGSLIAAITRQALDLDLLDIFGGGEVVQQHQNRPRPEPLLVILPCAARWCA